HPALEIGEGEDVGNARQAARRVGLDRKDLGVAVRAPHKGRVEQARQLDVVDVAAFAAEKARVFRAANGGSEVLGAHGDARPYQPAAHVSSRSGSPSPYPLSPWGRGNGSLPLSLLGGRGQGEGGRLRRGAC